MTAPVQHPMYIDGQFVSGRGDGWIDVFTRRPKRCCRGSRTGLPKRRGWRLTPPSAPSPAGKRCRPLSVRAGCAKLPPVSASVPTRSPG